MDLITIIIPIYNSEKYLKRCLDSIINQTYKNLEIILINDGSIDQSENICKYYKSKDDRINYIYQANEGVGSARNRGIEAATGKYLFFCDSDDAIPKCGIENLWKRRNDGDLVVGGIGKTENGNYRKYVPASKIVDGKKAISDILVSDGYYLNGPCDKLFLTEIICNKHIMFNSHPYGEDTCFVYDYLLYTEKICFINRVVYNVYANEGSLSTKKVYNSWEALRLVYESGKEICPENIPANHLLLMRCIKTVLLLESHISKGSFITNCKNILKYYIRENYNGQFNEGKYNMIIQNLLLSKRFKLLYHIMRLRTILHV